MKLSELKDVLNEHPSALLHFVLPDGASVPAHAHVTEVARIDKRFVDCGGTLRSESLCRLQTWSAHDIDHRLTAGKLTKILDKAKSVLGADDLEVDIEHQAGYISQFPVKSLEVLPGQITLRLAERHTACLAEDKCLPPKRPETPAFNPMTFDPRAEQKPRCGADEGCVTNLIMKRKVLVICIHNSARSQMAEAFLKQRCGNQFEVQSAGLEPGKLNPIVVEAMKEIGIDISGNPTKAVFDMIKSGQTFAYVITVCDEASAERCPIFPGVARRLHWSFPDPSGFSGTPAEKLARVREVRDTIKSKVEAWCDEVCAAPAC